MVRTRGLVAAIEAADAMASQTQHLSEQSRIGSGLVTVMARGDVGGSGLQTDAAGAAAGSRFLGELVSVHVIRDLTEMLRRFFLH